DQRDRADRHDPADRESHPDGIRAPAGPDEAQKRISSNLASGWRHVVKQTYGAVAAAGTVVGFASLLSVRKGDAGRSAPLYKLNGGASPLAYRTNAGVPIAGGAATMMVSPSIFTSLVATNFASSPAIEKPAGLPLANFKPPSAWVNFTRM